MQRNGPASHRLTSKRSGAPSKALHSTEWAGAHSASELDVGQRTDMRGILLATIAFLLTSCLGKEPPAQTERFTLDFRNGHNLTILYDAGVRPWKNPNHPHPDLDYLYLVGNPGFDTNDQELNYWTVVRGAPVGGRTPDWDNLYRARITVAERLRGELPQPFPQRLPQSRMVHQRAGRQSGDRRLAGEV
jgi:hypothetical protein